MSESRSSFAGSDHDWSGDLGRGALIVPSGFARGAALYAGARAAVAGKPDGSGAAAARTAFRSQVRDYVLALREQGEDVGEVLRHTRVMMRIIADAGVVDDESGELEDEIIGWAVEEYHLGP